MRLNLKHITFYVLSKKDAFEKKAIIGDQLRRLGLKFQFVAALESESSPVSWGLSLMKLLADTSLELPFATIYDSTLLDHNFQHSCELPDEADALYLQQAGPHSEALRNTSSHPAFQWYSPEYVRLMDDPGSQCIVFLSPAYRSRAKQALVDAMVHPKGPLGPGEALATLQRNSLVLSPINNSVAPGPAQLAEDYSKVIEMNRLKRFELFQEEAEEKDLFLDLFVHWSRRRITAVALHYGQEAGILGFQTNLWLEVEKLRIKGECTVLGNEAEEGVLLINFEHDQLRDMLGRRPALNVTVSWGPVSHTYHLINRLQPHRLALVSVIEPTSRWVSEFARYYLDFMEVDHLFLYLRGIDPAGLRQRQTQLRSFIRKGRITLIPWRMTNTTEEKQQPRSDLVIATHARSKFGAGEWLGFLGIQEYAFLPDQTLGEYLRRYDASKTPVIGFAARRFVLEANNTGIERVNPLNSPAFPGPKLPDLDGSGPVFFSQGLTEKIALRQFFDNPEDGPLTQSQVSFHHYEAGPVPQGSAKEDRSLEQFCRKHENIVKLRERVDQALLMAERGEASRAVKHKWTETGIASYPRMGCFLNHVMYWQFRKVLLLGACDLSIIWSLLSRNFFFFTMACPLPEGAKEEFLQTIRSTCSATRLKITDGTWREIEPEFIDEGFNNIFVSTVGKSYEEQLDVLMQVYPRLSDVALLIITNWNDSSVRSGAQDALKELRANILFERLIRTDDARDPHWGNGLGIFGIRKTEAKTGEFTSLLAAYRARKF